MKKYLLGLALGCIVAACQTERTQPKLDVEKDLAYCAEQVCRALDSLRRADGSYDYTMEPRNILEGETAWNCRKASAEEWCSGFWPGVLWMTLQSEELRMKNEEFAAAIPEGEKTAAVPVGEKTAAVPVGEKTAAVSEGEGKAEANSSFFTLHSSLKQAAEGYTETLKFLASQPAYDHDLGFLVINSFLKGYEATGREDYKQTALACADTLATLFNPTVGTILSWPRHVKDYGGHNTIMDNMINLELLFWAAQENEKMKNGKNEKLHDIAVKHAETTMQNHFRPDGSCYHVAVYDTLTGAFIKGVTHQGYADSSMWSRGQSWAIYGYTMVYRFTKDKRFLDFAQEVTDIYLKRLHETSDDWVPLWDMDDPRGTSAPKDASAACVVASALLELCGYVDEAKGKVYYDAATQMLADLSTDKYQSREKNVAFLMHSTGHHPAGTEIDASIIYADYYYIEALLRMRERLAGQR